MKIFKMLLKVIILLIVLYYGSSYLFNHLGTGLAKDLVPPFTNWGMEAEPRPDPSQKGLSTPGTPGNDPGQEKEPDLTRDSTDKGTVPETITPEDDQAKAKQILITRFSKADLAALRNLAKGGLTEKEKSEALAIIRSRLTKEEFDLLYHKYYLPHVKPKVNN